MKVRINGYQVIYDTNCRDDVKFGVPVMTEDTEALRTRLMMMHNGMGKRVVGINLKYEVFSDYGRKA